MRWGSVSRVDGANQYAELFGRYVRAANGKAMVGAAIADLAAQYVSPVHVLDMGAGRGDIAEVIASSGYHVDAVEPNPHLAAKLRERALVNPHLNAIEDSLEGYDSDEKYGLIVLSYVIESVKDRALFPHVEKLYRLLAPNGRIVGVTFLDGCAWDAYSAEVNAFVTWNRTGGVSRVFPRLRRSGYNVRIERIVSTEIVGETVDELYDTLEFFYRHGLDEYSAQKEKLVPILEGFLGRMGSSKCSLEIDEVLFEVLPMTGKALS